jgi:hypothetical protein
VPSSLRRVISGAGAACLVVSALCFASDTALRAAPLLGINVPLSIRLPFDVPVLGMDQVAPAATPSASPSPSPTATPKPKAHRGFLGPGPIVLRGDGTYQLGVNSSSRNALTTSYDNYSTALSLTAERRTESSSLAVSSAIGYGIGAVSAGTLIASYSTPKYALTYGQLAGPSDTQLEIGGFARGIGLTIPLRNGDVSLFGSTAQQQGATTYRIYGVRRTWNALGGSVSATGYYGSAEGGSPSSEAIGDVSFQHYGKVVSTDTELAVSSTRGVSGIPDGALFAGAFRADVQGASTFSTLSVRDDPAGFDTLSGLITGGLNADLLVHKHTSLLGDLSLDLNHTDTSVDGDVEHDDHATFSGSRSWSHFGFQYAFGLDDARLTGNDSLSRNAALSLTQSVGKLSLFETYQASGVSATTGDAQQSQVALGASRDLWGGSGAIQVSRSLSGGSAGATAVGTGEVETVSYRRSIGRKLDVQFAESVQSTSNDGVTSSVVDSSVSFLRRLSSVVAIQVSADRFHQSGIGGGNGTTFNASIIGPFGFGAPTSSSGRTNPNLPASIRGTVAVVASSLGGGYSAQSQRGLANALIVLDGAVSERTDSFGQFEFRFVKSGAHTIRLDPATIPAGLIADRETQPVNVLGGQVMSIQFSVGNFAGVTGSVMAKQANGTMRPLADVGIAVDGLQAVTTGSDGHYALGRLNPGAHTVAVVESTLPSTVAISGERKRTVTVSAGTAVPVDFLAVPLGSIAGKVLAPGSGGFGNIAGIENVYVVAEPGEHAVITDQDGAFLLDNMPAGTYTLTVDPDTIPDGLSVLSGPDGPVDLAAGAEVSGIVFKLGEGAKNVVFTYTNGKRRSIQVETRPAVVPPGGVLHIVARTQAKDVKQLNVESDVFGSFPLRFDPHGDLWTGEVVVPALSRGDYAFTVTAHRDDIADGQALVPVDPAIPLIVVRIGSQNAVPGHTMRVTLRALAPVAEGDVIVFQDGYKVTLPKPSGGIFGLDLRLWRRGLPYSGILTTKRGASYPLSLR